MVEKRSRAGKAACSMDRQPPDSHGHLRHGNNHHLRYITAITSDTDTALPIEHMSPSWHSSYASIMAHPLCCGTHASSWHIHISIIEYVSNMTYRCLHYNTHLTIVEYTHCQRAHMPPSWHTVHYCGDTHLSIMAYVPLSWHICFYHGTCTSIMTYTHPYHDTHMSIS